MTIHLLPIEPFEERYTEQWYRWWKTGLEQEGHTVNIIDGIDVGERKGGEWLDPTKTWIWKGRQLENLARAFHDQTIKDGDVILSLDMWNPCLTGALYMRDTADIKVKIGAFYHAGASDPNDFLARKGLRKWALNTERGWVKGIDFILCGSDFAGKMLKRNLSLHDLEGAEIYPTGYPIYRSEIVKDINLVPFNKRERIVVFPHRLAPEKQPHLFKVLEHKYKERFGDDGTKFIRTRDVCNNKKEYYQLLAKSKVSISFAKQETFGIAQQEAASLGCWLLNPMCCSYPEVTRGTGIFYEPYDINEVVVKLKVLLDKSQECPYSDYNERAIKRASDVITHKSAILPVRYKNNSIHEYHDFWVGEYKNHKTLFINKLPTEYISESYFGQIDMNDIQCVYFCGAYDLSIQEHRKYFYDLVGFKKQNIVVCRYYGDHTCLHWEYIHSLYYGDIEIIHKIHLQYDNDDSFEVGEPLKSKVMKVSGYSKENYKHGTW